MYEGTTEGKGAKGRHLAGWISRVDECWKELVDEELSTLRGGVRTGKAVDVSAMATPLERDPIPY